MDTKTFFGRLQIIVYAMAAGVIIYTLKAEDKSPEVQQYMAKVSEMNEMNAVVSNLGSGVPCGRGGYLGPAGDRHCKGKTHHPDS